MHIRYPETLAFQSKSQFLNFLGDYILIMHE